LYESIFSDVNDHYTDEHLIMTQSDLLEQMYSKEIDNQLYRYADCHA